MEESPGRCRGFLLFAAVFEGPGKPVFLRRVFCGESCGGFVVNCGSLEPLKGRVKNMPPSLKFIFGGTLEVRRKVLKEVS